MLVVAVGVALLELDADDDVSEDKYKARAGYVVEIAVAEPASRMPLFASPSERMERRPRA